MSLIFTPEQISQIELEGSQAYPNECCGAMLGKDIPDGQSVRRLVHRLHPLKNSFSEEEKYHRFSLDPRELMQIEKLASQQGMAVLGFYHSHPDHPAKPSEYDRTHAWPFYSYVIVAIAGGKPVDLTSWQLDEATEQFQPEQVVSNEMKGTS